MIYSERLNQSFQFKLLLFYALLWSILFTSTGVISYQTIYHRLEEKMGEQLLAMTKLVAQQLEPNISPELQPSFFDTPASMALTGKLRSFLKAGVLENIVLLNQQGTVLLDATGEAVPGFKSSWFHGKDMDFLSAQKPLVLPIQEGDFSLLHQSVLLPFKKAFILEVDVDPHYLDILREFKNLSLALGLVGFVVSGIAGAFIARMVLRLMDTILQMTEGVMKGHYPLSENNIPSNDLGRWVQIIQNMFKKIHGRETELTLLRQLAENQAEQMRQVAAGIAHEVRNPLSVIQGQVDWLKKTGTQDPKLRLSLEKIQSQVQTINQLVSRFLEYSGVFKPKFQTLLLQDFIYRLIENLSDQARQQEVQVLNDLGPCPPLFADKDLLYNSFYNLAMNALQAMPQGGTLIIRLKQILNKAFIEVEDTGPGIAPENFSKLFKPFFSTKNEGTGLGLAFAEKVFHAHGGQIEALNRPEGGAVFRVILPLQKIPA